MQTVHDFLKKTGTCYLATIDGNQPRVRPFGTMNLFEGKFYIQTGKKKDVAKQITANPKVEVSAVHGRTWIRIAAVDGVHCDCQSTIRVCPYSRLLMQASPS